MRPFHRAWIVLVALAPLACAAYSAATPASDASHVARAPSSSTAAERLARASHAPKALDTGCPPDMAPIDSKAGRYCIDRWEASLVELDVAAGWERAHSPYYPVNGANVKAVSRAGVVPQGYISAREASQACARAGKRLCKPMEWRKACVGPEPKTYGYGDHAEPHRCNDDGRSPVLALFGPSAFSRAHAWERMNTPELNQLDHTLAKTGDHPGCTNGYGVYDMVGNLHEWVEDPRGAPRPGARNTRTPGSFYGGFYQDTRQHGEGCTYETVAHDASYHDYSTGFRCCADAR